jgi:superfamily II DNA or RNA helicase
VIFSPKPWPVEPRRWQAECLPIITRHYSQPAASPGMVRAVTGSGKSLLIAQLCNCATGRVIVTTSTRPLVRQLRQTIAHFSGGNKTVGAYFTDSKHTQTDVIVVCNDSIAELARRIPPPAFTICDEAHTTQADTVKDAIAALNCPLRLGVSGTPFRSRHSESLQLFETLLYDFGPHQALADGVVVPMKIIPWTGSPNTSTDDAVLQMLSIAHGPGIVDASNVEDAEQFSRRLNQSGIPAASIHYRTSDSEQYQRIKALKEGRLKAVVQINMLTEGADFPWLQWGCFRRNVESRVRFLQYLGRFLRVSPGKTHATIYDPNDLCDTFRITYEAALGAEPSEDEILEELIDLPPDALAEALSRDVPEAVALEVFECELRRLVLACDFAGMCPDRPLKKKESRSKSASRLQIIAVNEFYRTAKDYIPQSWGTFIQMTVAHAGRINASACADLSCVLNSIAKAKRFPPIDAEGRISTSGESKRIVRGWPEVQTQMNWN